MYSLNVKSFTGELLGRIYNQRHNISQGDLLRIYNHADKKVNIYRVREITHRYIMYQNISNFYAGDSGGDTEIVVSYVSESKEEQ